ncbi:hypothetical protein UFOVP787_58 [uncultured Caudovirales phage]|uniref:Uncharacterized protein n=1 Tax=uncultured Caudovirales phage TaxID=2100421 RepID=A0A6J5NU94_9CAUD|nr:hypothetical protein UFOVP787_58 [uncultured Caudovirales phage]
MIEMIEKRIEFLTNELDANRKYRKSVYETFDRLELDTEHRCWSEELRFLKKFVETVEIK